MYRFPFIANVAAPRLSVGDVPPGTGLNVAPLSVLTNHCTVGAGVPFALDPNPTLVPTQTLVLSGWPVICGATPPPAGVKTAEPVSPGL